MNQYHVAQLDLPDIPVALRDCVAAAKCVAMGTAAYVLVRT